MAAGETVPIRFDPKNRSQVEIDTPAVDSRVTAEQARSSAAAQKLQDAAVERAEQALKPIDS